jgi:hypothetical protein
MDWAQVTDAVCFFEESFESSLDILAAHMELGDSIVDLHRVEDIHCSLEALAPPVYRSQIPYE